MMWYVDQCMELPEDWVRHINLFFFRINTFFVTLWWLTFLMILMLMLTSKNSFEIYVTLINSCILVYIAELEANLDTMLLI